jgi:hypothetical protein
MGFAQGKAQKGDYPGALAGLKALKDLLARSPTAATAAAQADPKHQSPTASADQDAFKERYEGLFETVPGDLRRLRQVDPAAAEQIQKVVDGAAVHAGKGDFQKAFDLLNRAADVIAKATGAGRAKEAAEVIPEGKVAGVKAAFEKARVRWDAARERARVGIGPLLGDLQAEYPLAVTGLNNVINSYWRDLQAALEAGQALQNQGDVDKAIRAALAQIQALKAEAAGDKLLTYLDSCGLQVQAAFIQAFDDVVQLIHA